MMNHLTSTKIAWDNLLSVHISMLYAQGLLDGVLNHFAERLWGMKTFSIFKRGYEIFSNCVKLSSALVPRIKNDRPLIPLRSICKIMDLRRMKQEKLCLHLSMVTLLSSFTHGSPQSSTDLQGIQFANS